jgi:hypothetical protein
MMAPKLRRTGIDADHRAPLSHPEALANAIDTFAQAVAQP